MTTNPDCRHRSRGVWLIKVPKYLSQRWRNLAGASEVGRLKIAKIKSPNGKVDVKFYSTTATPNCSEGSDGGSSQSSVGSQSFGGYSSFAEAQGQTVSLATDVPQVHEVSVSSLNNQSLVVLREDKRSAFDIIDEKPPNLSIEGRVVQRAECKPPALSLDYQLLKRKLNENAKRPTNQLQSIEKAEIKFKPISQHVEHMASERAKKDNKNVRMEKTVLMDVLFQAFEKYQFYKLVDLSRVTAQPPNYLKEVLQEIATYNTMPPHKYTWELKPEYRHYKEPESENA